MKSQCPNPVQNQSYQAAVVQKSKWEHICTKYISIIRILEIKKRNFFPDTKYIFFQYQLIQSSVDTQCNTTAPVLVWTFLGQLYTIYIVYTSYILIYTKLYLETLVGRFTFRPPAVLRLWPSSIYPGLVTQTGHYQGDQEQDNADDHSISLNTGCFTITVKSNTRRIRP